MSMSQSGLKPSSVRLSGILAHLIENARRGLGCALLDKRLDFEYVFNTNTKVCSYITYYYLNKVFKNNSVGLYY